MTTSTGVAITITNGDSTFPRPKIVPNMALANPIAIKTKILAPTKLYRINHTTIPYSSTCAAAVSTKASAISTQSGSPEASETASAHHEMLNATHDTVNRYANASPISHKNCTRLTGRNDSTLIISRCSGAIPTAVKIGKKIMNTTS